MNRVTALTKGSSFTTPPCEEETKRSVCEALSMFSPDIESSVVLILGFLTSRLSIYKFPCLQISPLQKKVLCYDSQWTIKQPHLCEHHPCVLCMLSLGKNLRKLPYAGPAFLHSTRVNKTHTFCFWGSP